MLMLNRGFFSLQEAWLPTWVALGNLGLNAVLDALLFWVGMWGLPLATSLVNIAGTAALLFLLRRRVGPLELRASFGAVGRMLVAAVPLAIVTYGVWWAARRRARAVVRGPGGSASRRALVAGGAVYLVACRVLGLRELRALLSLRGRFRGA